MAGKGCGCALCERPIIEPTPQSPEQARLLNALAAEKRRDWVREAGVVSGGGRGK